MIICGFDQGCPMVADRRAVEAASLGLTGGHVDARRGSRRIAWKTVGKRLDHSLLGGGRALSVAILDLENQTGLDSSDRR